MKIPVLGLGVQGRSPNLSAMRRVNLYLEIDPEGDRTKVSAHPTPGLSLFADLGDSPCRGHYAVGNFDYVVHRGTFWEINSAGTRAARGTLTTTSGRVSMSDNGVEIFIADGVTKGWVYNLSTLAFTQVTDADAVISDTVTFLDTHFIVNKKGTGEVRFSDGFNGLTWQSTSFFNAESNPDAVVAVLAERSSLYLFGEFTLEIWSGIDTSPVPFAPLKGSSQEWGLAARDSLVKFDQALIFLGKNRLGQVSAMTIAGDQVTRVSTPDLDFLINTYPTTANATGISYMLNGHPMYQISFPSAGKSWLFDGKTTVWSELMAIDGTRHRGEIATSHLGFRRVSDFENGKIYTLDSEVFTDNGEQIQRELAGGHVFAEAYNQLFLSELRLDIETGIGLVSGQGVIPQIALSMSRDGGHTFGGERWTSLGKIGEFRTRARWRRLGRARNFHPKIRMTDPVKFAFLGADLYATQADV